MKVALLCGGPSSERGISLNSARSVLDHLGSDAIEIVPIYFDSYKKPYHISTAQLYSNNPSDFDFKLAETGRPLSQPALIKLLRSVDMVFPVMHGAYGEDGAIQSFLEKNNIPFIGSPSSACKLVFDKYKANEYIREKGFYTLPSAVLKIYAKDHKKIITGFFKEHRIKRAIVKPATGGSSIGVFSVGSVAEALEKVETIFKKRMDTRVVIEPFATGTEFTVILLANRFGTPVAILPTEIETDYQNNQIFDFRKKYLPSRQVKYHCPPRFSNSVIEKIQIQAEQLFTLFGMQDFARFDGWVMSDGNIWFSDFNPISGMEQNSFLFQQAARIGFSHRDTLRYILARACTRQGVKIDEPKEKISKRKEVPVLFGGATAERQVSLMSGTNVWLKLRTSKKYMPVPYVLSFDNHAWKLPYALILNHTVEEILENAERATIDMERLADLTEKVITRLGLVSGDATEKFFLPEKLGLEAFIEKFPFVFLALHGGIGENGEIQALLEKSKKRFNGSSSKVSALCMDKWKTSEAITACALRGVSTPKHRLVPITALQDLESKEYRSLWKELVHDLGSKTLIVKPRGDGCSAGIVRLQNESDLKAYVHFAQNGSLTIPKNTFSDQLEVVEMPLLPMSEIIFEEFITTDIVRVKANHLKYTKKSGWVEVTCGVLEEGDILRALNPSITVAEGAVLSVEEKFQGGTGVNITPPPEELIHAKILARARTSIQNVARALRIEGYARIDAFLELRTGNVKIIEVNTLPGLTPSTVLYHQALAEKAPIFPRELLELLIKNKGY